MQDKLLSYFNGDELIFESYHKGELYGKLNYNNNDVYVGSFDRVKNDSINWDEFNLKREGEGELTYSNGNKFIGTFKDDKLQKGKMYYKKGNIYEGKFRDNKFDGFGKTVQEILDKKEGLTEGSGAKIKLI